VKWRTVPLVALASFVLLACGGDKLVVCPSTTGMVGRWQGEAENMWARQKRMGFTLTILPDGKVEGMIGDAAIVQGRLVLQAPPGWLGYLVQARLSGPIARDEGIERKSLIIFVDFQGNRIVGSYRTSGTVFGGKRSMVMDGDLVDVVKVAE
jgi:hypothetical protein